MIETIFHTSENRNMYLYDDHKRLSMLVHPDLIKVQESFQGADPYYVNKYSYLKKHGLFSKPKKINFNTTINESIVENSIVQTHQIVFEVTDYCNLECSYCVLGDFYGSFESNNSKKIDTHSAIQLLKYVYDLKVNNDGGKLTISFYGGEPLLNVKFIKIIVETVKRLNCDRKIDVLFNMTTNGVLLHKYIDFLVENKFDLLISLDGDERSHSYRSFRKNKENSFQQVIQNLDMIYSKFPSYFERYVHFNAVLHDRNSIKKIYEFIYNRFHKIPQISELAKENIKPDKKHDFDRMFNHKKRSEKEFLMQNSDLISVTHQELSLFKESTEFIKHYSINYFISNITSLLYDDSVYYPTNTCLPFSKKIFLTNHNKLLPCEKLNHKFSMGEIKENINIDISKIAQRFNNYYERLQKNCQSCYIHRFCGVCMFRIDNLDELDAEKLDCGVFHDQKAFQNKMHRVFSFLEKHPNDIIDIIENVVITS